MKLGNYKEKRFIQFIVLEDERPRSCNLMCSVSNSDLQHVTTCWRVRKGTNCLPKALSMWNRLTYKNPLSRAHRSTLILAETSTPNDPITLH